MTSNTSPITTAREALDNLLAEAERGRSSDGYIETVNGYAHAVTAALDLAEKLKAERDELEKSVSAHWTEIEHLNAATDSEVTRLTSQLEQAERVMKPFADAALSPGGRRWGLTVTAERLFEGEEISPLPKTDDFVRAEKWIKDRQAKGEG